MAAKKRDGRGGARAGSGPKPKSARELKRNRLMLNLTDDEMIALRRVAGRQRPTAFARDVLVKYLARRPRATSR